MLGTGTSNDSNSSSLYNYYKMKSIPDENKMVLDWEKIYKYKLFISQKHADRYRRHVESEISDKGINSIIIQTEYYCSFSASTDKFITMEGLENNNIMTEEIEDNISNYVEKNVYRIGCIDFSLSHDRCTFMSGITGFTEDLTWTKAKNYEIIKDLNETIDPIQIIRKAIMYCNKNKLDYLMVDNTASQRYLTIPLYKRMLEETKTQIIPFDFSGSSEKVKMCKYNEALLAQQSYKIAKMDYYDQNEAFKVLIEELITLEKKQNANGEYSYRAEKSLHDDMAMCFFMLGYSLKFLKECIDNRKVFQLGNHSHRIYLRKNTEEITNKPTSRSKTYARLR